MNLLKKSILAVAASLVLSTALPSALPKATLTVQAAEIKLNKTKLTLTEGKASSLKISGTKKKVSWSSNNKKVAAVSSKGKVTAKAKGKAVITATLGNKKYSCTVTVKAKPAESQYVKDAPFKAKEVEYNGFRIVIPKEWTGTEQELSGQKALVIQPKNSELNSSSYFFSYIATPTNISVEDFQVLFQETFEKPFKDLGFVAEDTNPEISSVPAGESVAFRYHLNALELSAALEQTFIFTDDGILFINVSLYNKNNEEVKEAADYAINTVQKK